MNKPKYEVYFRPNIQQYRTAVRGVDREVRKPFPWFALLTFIGGLVGIIWLVSQ